jgi:phosphatidylserine/phosphatidylglycerophosphate/cardiolipin synthase-like enzyme
MRRLIGVGHKLFVCLVAYALMSCASTDRVRPSVQVQESRSAPTNSTTALLTEPTALFSPYDDVEAAIHTELQKVASSVHCSLYGISNKTLAGDLEALAKAGKDVKIGIDHVQASGSHDLHEALRAAGVRVEIKPKHAAEHNKFCILDGQNVIMGSWNWSANAQSQDNSDLIFIQHPSLADKFEQAFQRIWLRDQPPF